MPAAMTFTIDQRAIQAKVRGSPVKAGQVVWSRRDKARRAERREFQQGKNTWRSGS